MTLFSFVAMLVVLDTFMTIGTKIMGKPIAVFPFLRSLLVHR